MWLRLRILVPGTRVRLRRPGRGERGTWLVGDRLVGSGLDDPAYELRQERSGPDAHPAPLPAAPSPAPAAGGDPHG
jgi:hypothetical protein